MLVQLRGCFWLSLLALVACDGEKVSPLLTPDSGPEEAVDSGPSQVFVGIDVNCYWDGDADGYGAGPPVSTARYPLERCPFSTTPRDGDCIDIYATVYPGAPERCDDLDNDCDEEVDEGAPEATAWYLDDDGDGYGAGDPILNCRPYPGAASQSGDCDNDDPARNPGASEVCNGTDDDCDGVIDDDASDAPTWFPDADGDGYGANGGGVVSCEGPTGYVLNAADCEDLDPTRHPGAEELDCADPIDYNCDGSVGYADADLDGWVACEDCDDADAATFPGAPESCDGRDEDCDGVVDPPSAVDAATWYRDADGDGWGLDAQTAPGCAQPSGYAATPGDCDDTNAGTNPGALEVCEDGIDNDCSGTASGCGAWGTIDLDQEADLTIVGEAAGDWMTVWFGLGAAGDYNADGYDDFLLGSAFSNRAAPQAGVAYVYLGGEGVNQGLGTRIAVFEGEAGSDYAGAGLAAAGDTNGDGYDDVLIGAPQETTHSGMAGAAYLVLGPTSGVMSLSAANARLDGENYDDRAAYCLSGAGDVNGDGLADVLVGASHWGQTAFSIEGAAYLMYGPLNGAIPMASADLVLRGESAGDVAGADVEGLGDVNGDGLDDIGVGASGRSEYGVDAGMAYVLTTPLGGTMTLADADARLGGAAYQNAGVTISTAGDTNQDGYGDILVGAPFDDTNNTNAGMVYFVPGPVSGTRALSDVATSIYLGIEQQELAGSDVDGGQDVDGDGWADLLIGGPQGTGNSGFPGRAYLVRGALVAGTHDLTATDAFLSGAVNDNVGATVAFVGDTNGDGLADMLIGAPGATTFALATGKAHLIFGGNP